MWPTKITREAIRELQRDTEKMGHASALTTLDYTHTVTDEGRKYAERVEAAFPLVLGVRAKEGKEVVQ